jgi:hypothetical protein
MLRGWRYPDDGQRDLRIDWLRGLAMVCVIVDHSKLSSLFSWFSYERFWTVTAAEVFVVLSGVVLGSVYGSKLDRGEWRSVVRRLGRRAVTLYVAFIAVTFSVVALGRTGVDVGFLTMWDDRVLDSAAWRDIVLMHSGPWAFEIVAMYVWLVAAAVPCLLTLRFAGWRPLLAVSWALYLWYRISPHPLTAAQFEANFPILAWQLLFVHGLAIGYHRKRLGALVAGVPRWVPAATVAAAAAFILFALSNPWTDGPAALHWNFLDADRFSELYAQYFGLSELGVGRLLNLAVGLPIGYAALTAFWKAARPLGAVLIPLGQQSLGAFVLHVYALLLIAHLPEQTGGLWINTAVHLAAILAITALLAGSRAWRRSPAIAERYLAPEPTIS